METVEDEEYLGIGYIFNKEYWHRGYAFESAAALMNYAFTKLQVQEITAQIKSNNLASIKVIEKLGMQPKKAFIRHYKGKELTHILYSKTRIK